MNLHCGRYETCVAGHHLGRCGGSDRVHDHWRGGEMGDLFLPLHALFGVV